MICYLVSEWHLFFRITHTQHFVQLEELLSIYLNWFRCLYDRPAEVRYAWDAFVLQIFIQIDLDACVTDLRKLDDYEKRELMYEVKTFNHLPTCYLHYLVKMTATNTSDNLHEAPIELSFFLVLFSFVFWVKIKSFYTTCHCLPLCGNLLVSWWSFHAFRAKLKRFKWKRKKTKTRKMKMKN